MPNVLGRQALTSKNVAEVSAAACAQNLRSSAVTVHLTFHGTGDLVVEARTAAIGFEFVIRDIQWRPTLPTDVSASLEMVPVPATERPFRALLQDNPLFLSV